MNKLIFLGLLSFMQVSFLMADEYISDAYFEEVSAQAEVSYQSLESLPITKTLEEEERDRDANNQLIEQELYPIVLSPSTEEKQTIQAMSYEKALAQARNEGKIILLNIRATDCKYCDEMEEGTLSDASVKEAIADAFIEITYNQDLDTLPLNLQNGATPMFIFVNTNEDIINMYPGIRTPKEFKAMLKEILTK